MEFTVHEPGITGITMQNFPPGIVFIKAVEDGSWADAQGISPGCTITHLNDQDCEAMPKEEFKKHMKGRPLTLRIEGIQEVQFPALHFKRSDSDVIDEPEENGHHIEVTSKEQGTPLGFRTNRKPPGHVMVTFVAEGTFAERKGILPGYIIQKLNGINLQEMDGQEFKMHMTTRPCSISFWVPRSEDDPDKPQLLDHQGDSVPESPRSDRSEIPPQIHPQQGMPKADRIGNLEAPTPVQSPYLKHGAVADIDTDLMPTPELVNQISIPIPETSALPTGTDAGLSEEDKITYVSDVEGHWDYFCRYVELSSALRFVTDDGTGSAEDAARMREPPELELADGWQFVYGGDSCDKGPGTIRFVTTLVKLKKKHPDRVHLIMGNRDINKMRLTSELADSQTDLEGFKRSAAAYWVAPDRRVTPIDFLRKHVAARTGSAVEDVTDDVLVGFCNKANKFKYMLINDMGSDGEFEFRRQELSYMRSLDVTQITDEDVMESYEEGVRAGGIMREYLENAKLALILGNTLFVHGQIIGNDFKDCGRGGVATSIKHVPGVPYNVDDIKDWVARLNEWAGDQVDQWIEQPMWETVPKESTREAWAARGGARLIDYGTPATNEPSVVYCRWLEKDCMPKPYPDDLVNYLTRSDIHHVVVGHTPHGNCPTVIPHPDLILVMADTSFSKMGSHLRFRGDNRGDAVSEVAIDDTGVHIRGRTECQQIIDYTVHPNCAGLSDSFVGRLQDGDGANKFFVKAKLPSMPGRPRSAYLMCRMEGFKTEYTVLTRDETMVSLGGGLIPRNDSFTMSITSFGDIFDCEEGAGNDKLLDYIFNRLDVNADGSVTFQELLAACASQDVRTALAYSFPGQTVEDIAAALDANSDGLITKEECRGAFHLQQEKRRSLELCADRSPQSSEVSPQVSQAAAAAATASSKAVGFEREAEALRSQLDEEAIASSALTSELDAARQEEARGKEAMEREQRMDAALQLEISAAEALTNTITANERTIEEQAAELTEESHELEILMNKSANEDRAAMDFCNQELRQSLVRCSVLRTETEHRELYVEVEDYRTQMESMRSSMDQLRAELQVRGERMADQAELSEEMSMQLAGLNRKLADAEQESMSMGEHAQLYKFELEAEKKRWVAKDGQEQQLAEELQRLRKEAGHLREEVVAAAVENIKVHGASEGSAELAHLAEAEGTLARERNADLLEARSQIDELTARSARLDNELNAVQAEFAAVHAEVSTEVSAAASARVSGEAALKQEEQEAAIVVRQAKELQVEAMDLKRLQTCEALSMEPASAKQSPELIQIRSELDEQTEIVAALKSEVYNAQRKVSAADVLTQRLETSEETIVIQAARLQSQAYSEERLQEELAQAADHGVMEVHASRSLDGAAAARLGLARPLAVSAASTRPLDEALNVSTGALTQLQQQRRQLEEPRSVAATAPCAPVSDEKAPGAWVVVARDEEMRLGVTFRRSQLRPTIGEVASCGWGAKNGVTMGTRVLAINGEDTANMPAERWNALLRQRPLRLLLQRQQDLLKL